jgi:hypothetical protein
MVLAPVLALHARRCFFFWHCMVLQHFFFSWPAGGRKAMGAPGDRGGDILGQAARPEIAQKMARGWLGIAGKIVMWAHCFTK